MKNMTKWFSAAVLSVSLAAGSLAVAQTTPNNNAAREHGMHRGGEGRQMDPAKRIEKMKQNLNLSDAQAAQIKTILEQNQAQMKQTFESLKGQDRNSDAMKAAREKMQANRLAVQQQIRAVLTADQQAKWDQMQKDREQKMKDHQANGKHWGRGGEKDGQRNQRAK